MAILLLGLRQTYSLYYWEKVIRANVAGTRVVTTKIVTTKIVRTKIVRTKHC
jgi:hypothetical protein